MTGPDDRRVRGRKIALSEAGGAVAEFFAGRAGRRDPNNPYVSVIYQDANPELALQRDAEEKSRVLARLDLAPGDRVLDVGCGVGRWADALRGRVGRYLGVDFSPEMIALAQARHDPAFATFHVMAAQDISAAALGGDFDLAIIAGVFIYMDDAEIVQCLARLRPMMARDGVVYLREPLALEERLTLNGVWSAELQQNYYAIYRTREEMTALIHAALGEAVSPRFEPLYGDPAMNNRQETRQFYCLIEGLGA